VVRGGVKLEPPVQPGDLEYPAHRSRRRHHEAELSVTGGGATLDGQHALQDGGGGKGRLRVWQPAAASPLLPGRPSSCSISTCRAALARTSRPFRRLSRI
jgi:hypothetical protein